MERKIEVLFAPAEFRQLGERDLRGTVCVVFDVLRATSTMVTAMAHDAAGIVPVSEIEEAVRLRQSDRSLLLAGERKGMRIGGDLSGGVEFDFGNSPREFRRERIGKRTIVMTTTNGTRALRACAGAAAVVIGSFLNLNAVANWVERSEADNLLVVCSGTMEECAYEDSLGAGALCHRIWEAFKTGASDSAQMARQLYLGAQSDLLEALSTARNARRLLAHSELADDVAYCCQRDLFDVVPVMGSDGVVRVRSRYTGPGS